MNPVVKQLVIAIDGPAGAGKSTVARMVATRLGYLHIDSGAMYRAITLQLLRLGVSPNDAEVVGEIASNTQVDLRPGVTPTGGCQVFLNGADVTCLIREPAVSAAVPLIAQYPKVRTNLVTQQKRLAALGGVVMDGRDIGTVVLPNADVKVFLTASLAERAARRQHEMAGKGLTVGHEHVAKEIAARDTVDSSRPVSPLVQAADAILIDTTCMSPEMVVAQIISICNERLQVRWISN